MTRRGQRRARARRVDTVATYRGRMSLIALVAGLFAGGALIVVQRQRLHRFIHELRGPHARVDVAEILLIARFSAIPLAIGILAYLLADQTIRLLRLIVYLRSLHAYAARALRIHAPLHAVGYETRFLTSTGGSPNSERARRPHDAVMSARRLLVAGAEGSGKSVALWSVVYERTRRRYWLPTYTGASPLPIMAPLVAYAEAQSETAESWAVYLARQIRVFGTPGLAARLPARMEKRPVLMICDDFDALTTRQVRHWVSEIDALDKTSRKPHRVVASVNERQYLDAPAQYAPLRDFETAGVQAVSQQEVASLLRRANVAAASGRAKPALGDALISHQLARSLEVPAHVAALARSGAGTLPLPFGRARVWDDALKSISLTTADHERAAQGDLARTLGQVASALVRANTRAIPIPVGRSIGRAVAEWLSANPPLYPLEVQSSETSDLSPEQIEIHCRRALQDGLLTRSPDGGCLQFAHRVVHAALAGGWLRLVDDGLGRLNAEFLQEQWIAPVLYWGGAVEAPGDLANRIVRLADTPDSTAIRADLAAREDVLPAALALAVAVSLEGIACQLARMKETIGAYDRAALIAEHHLRDLLDPAAVYLTDPDQQDRLAAALRLARSAVGPEIVDGAAELIHTATFSRLTRAQLISILGVMATPDAVAVCIGLLADADPVIRQAVNQAMIYAGPAALEPLRQALTHPDEHVRTRAAEALSSLGDVALDTAVMALHGSDARQRAAAVRTVSILGASQVIGDIIARLDDEDSAVRVAAARALGQVATPDTVAALSQHATSPDVALRAAVAKSLGMSHDPDALPPLLSLLQDQDGQVRIAAATALGVLGDERAATALRQRGEDADLRARHAALTALRRLGQTA